MNDLVKDLLQINPLAAAVPDYYGYLPLHLNLRAGKKWHNNGVKELFEAAPGALHVVDKDGLTPVMIASCVTHSDLTTIFELLRHNPPMAIC